MLFQRNAKIWIAIREFIIFFPFTKLWYQNNTFLSLIKLSFQNNTSLYIQSFLSKKCGTFCYIHKASFYKNSTLFEKSDTFRMKRKYYTKKALYLCSKEWCQKLLQRAQFHFNCLSDVQKLGSTKQQPVATEIFKKIKFLGS